jgi:hypothetical protein
VKVAGIKIIAVFYFDFRSRFLNLQ